VTVKSESKFGPFRDPHRWIVFAIICLVYFFVYFHRVSTSVIVSDLLEAFNTNATALGVMSSMYFYLYALEQPVVGYLADRIGPRKVIGYWSMAAAVGCCIFGMAPNIGWASVGRALIGLGVGGVYVPAIKAFSQWFRREQFSTMVGLLMSVGNLGAVIATTPLAWAAGTLGWRPTFFMIGGITMALAFATLILIRDDALAAIRVPAGDADMPEDEQVSPPGIFKILSSGRFWLIAAIFFGIYGTVVTLQGLWATPFLMSVLGIERMAASKLNMLIPIGVIFGAPISGWLTDRLGMDKRKALNVILIIYTASWIGLIFFFNHLGAFGLAGVLFFMGAGTGGFISTLWGLVHETTPARNLGLTSGLLNPAPFFGVAAYQVITGAILDRTGRVHDIYSLTGFRNAFLVCLASILVCLLLSFFLGQTTRR
jgi:sugar phosphate permease